MTTNLKNAINVHRQKAEWEEIIPLAREILSKDPGDLAALRSLADAYEKTDQQPKAAETWRLLVDRHHEITPFARKLGLALKSQGDNAARGYLEQALISAIDRKHLAEVEEIWLELVELGSARASFFVDFAQRLAGRREKERAGELLLIFMESAKLGSEDRLRCLRCIVEFLPERQTSFRDTILKAYQEVYSDRPDLPKLVDLAHIATSESVLESMIELDRFLKFGEGQFFYHSGWGAGKIRRIDPGQQRVFVDFAKKKDHLLTLEMADKSLTPIPAHDLRALLLENEDKVRQMAEECPVDLVKSALISMGGKANAKEVKDALLERPVPEAGWSKWWTSVSKKLKDDHYIEVTGGALKTFTLREAPEGPDEEYARRFRECRTLRGRLDILSDYRSHRRSECQPAILSQMVTDLISKASQTHSDSEAIEAVFVADELSSQVKVNRTHLDQIITPVLADLDRAVNALEGMRSVSLQSRWFTMMEEALREQLADAYERLLFDGPDSIRDLVAEHVARSHEEGVLENLFRKVRPIFRDASGLFIWFARRLLASPEAAEQAGITRPSLIEHLVGLHEVLGYRSKTTKKDASQELRAQMSDIRQTFKRSGFKRLREIMTETDITTARQLMKTTEGAVGIEDRIRKEITGYLSVHFHDQLTATSENAPPGPAAPLPTRLLCLEENLEAKHAQLKQLKEIDIPKNSKEIDAARQLGDLRENAEYHAAKERQGVLLSLVNTLQEELGRATSVREEEFTKDTALFGSRLRVRIGDSERTIILLGPWESNPDQDILSYESPLGQALWGHRAGDTFDFTSGGNPTPVEILSVESWNPSTTVNET